MNNCCLSEEQPLDDETFERTNLQSAFESRANQEHWSAEEPHQVVKIMKRANLVHEKFKRGNSFTSSTSNDRLIS